MSKILDDIKQISGLALFSFLFSLPVPSLLFWERLAQTSFAPIFEGLGAIGIFIIFTPHIAAILGFIALIQSKKYNKQSFYLAILGFSIGLIMVWAGNLMF